ncbi:MAG: iron-sulfur cluster assembly accessory protein [Alphaproteobacteria bacterium]
MTEPRQRRERPKLLTMTDRAASRIRELMEAGEGEVYGLRVGVSTKGCSGLSYTFEYAHEKKPMEDEVEQDGARILIEPMAIMYILGSEVDYVEDRLQSSFTFTNPNEKGRCGCGESFHV